jgi:hypothetical protein
MGGSGTLTLVTPTTSTIGNTLSYAMLDVARLLGGLRSGTATGGTTTTLVDTARTEEAEYWKGGTIWIMSGTQVGACLKIKSFSGNTITFFDTLSGAIVAGVEYYVFPPEYAMDELRHAIQIALNELGDIVDSDDTLTTDPDDEYYALPSGVYNIFRVEIATSDADPYGYYPNYYWKELNGNLHFLAGKKPGTDGFKIRLWYKAPHASVFEYSDTISDSVDRSWLSWAGVAGVLRNSIAVTGKDKAINIDLLNQAMMREQDLRNRQNRKNMVIVAPDPILNP